MIQIFSFKYLQDISFNTHTALKQKCHPCSFHSTNPPIQAYSKPYMAVDIQSLIFQQPNFLTRTEITVFSDESKFWDNPTLCYPLIVKGQNGQPASEILVKVEGCRDINVIRIPLGDFNFNNGIYIA